MRKKGERQQQILEALAAMLENAASTKITTAKLAAEVGVSEAALYRHFPSKGKMFESLIIFIEETIFSRITSITQQDIPAANQCEQILTLMLGFAEKNPGISRLLTDNSLGLESKQVQQRIPQFYLRLETQLKQIIREAELKEGIRPTLSTTAAANLLLAVVEGRIAQFVRSGFTVLPTAHWKDQWDLLMTGFFRKTMSASL